MANTVNAFTCSEIKRKEEGGEGVFVVKPIMVRTLEPPFLSTKN